MYKKTVLIVILLVSQLGFAGGKYGPEWTFTNEDIIEASQVNIVSGYNEREIHRQ